MGTGATGAVTKLPFKEWTVVGATAAGVPVVERSPTAPVLSAVVPDVPAADVVPAAPAMGAPPLRTPPGSPVLSSSSREVSPDWTLEPAARWFSVEGDRRAAAPVFPAPVSSDSREPTRSLTTFSSTSVLKTSSSKSEPSAIFAFAVPLYAYVSRSRLVRRAR